MAVFERGCFCCSVRTCVLVQAWIYSVLATIIVLIILGSFPFMDALYQNGTHSPERLEIWTLVTGVLYIGFVCSVLFAAVQITMLVGIYKRRTWMLVPHLVLTAILTLGFTIAALVKVQSGLATVAAVALFDCIQAYCWFHVLSYYLELKHSTSAVSPV